MPADFATRLASLDLSQARLRGWIERLTGRRLDPHTTSRWATGKARQSPEMDALLAVIERPERLQELRR